MKSRFLTVLVLCMVVFSLFIAGCSTDRDTTPESTTVPAETVPPETTPPNGNPNDATCLGTYSATGKEAADAARTVVATVDGAELTNGTLQIYYWLEVAAYRLENNETEPDFTKSLDTQICEIDSSVATWQQYFLREALNAWHAQQSLVLQAERERIPTEEAYQPDLEKHEAYLSDKPATKYLYGHADHYQPNEMHQAYLDSIGDTLAALAADNGFSGNPEQTQAIAGPGAAEADLLAYTRTANLAYMYFTELTYGLEPDDQQISDYFDAHEAAYAEAGITRSGEKSVDLRHILLIPDGAAVSEDGTVTCDEAAWSACLEQANAVVNKWNSAVKKTRFSQHSPVDVRESRFSDTAKDHSQDPGSRANGGLYENLRKGQLIPELDAWCFDESRQYADTAILRSPCGYHILFFCGSTGDWYAAAKADLLAELAVERITGAMEKHPITVKYSTIRLGQAPDNGSFVVPSDLLYPDVAHERYPSVPLYLQQDYPTARYGDYKLSSHGCGITTLSMLASYMTDEELTPPELASRYGYYCGLRGTEICIFDDTPAEMGFHLEKRSHSWDEIQAALENGQVVVSLQHKGYWTSGGHYLAITGVTDDGQYVVRDSNLLNYKRLPAHAEDRHARGSIVTASQYYWIYEPKVTRISACSRCGSGCSEFGPEILFREAYSCARCTAAMARRNTFLASAAG